MNWTRMLVGAVALSAALLLLPAAVASAQVPGQCASSAVDCTPTGPSGPPAGNVNVNADRPSGTTTGGEQAADDTAETPRGVRGITAVQGAPAVAAAEGSGGGVVGGLAFTGADVIQLVVLGVGSIVAGTMLLRRGRRGLSAIPVSGAGNRPGTLVA